MNKKQLTATCNDKYWVKEARLKKSCMILYKIQKQPKLTYRNRNQNSGYLWKIANPSFTHLLSRF